jgi:hypothetical protein
MNVPNVLDRPGGITLIEEELGGFGGFPEQLHLISVGDDKYACNNVTISEGEQTNGLACFPSVLEADIYMGLLGGLSGEVVSKSFEEAREIAKSKPVLSCLLLFVDGHVVEIHYVR